MSETLGIDISDVALNDPSVQLILLGAAFVGVGLFGLIWITLAYASRSDVEEHPSARKQRNRFLALVVLSGALFAGIGFADLLGYIQI